MTNSLLSFSYTDGAFAFPAAFPGQHKDKAVVTPGQVKNWSQKERKRGIYWLRENTEENLSSRVCYLKKIEGDGSL